MMKQSLMADIAESSVSESDVEELDYDVKEAIVPRNDGGWIELEVPCSGVMRDPTDVA